MIFIPSPVLKEYGPKGKWGIACWFFSYIHLRMVVPDAGCGRGESDKDRRAIC